MDCLDRCAAYLATRDALAAIRVAAPGWPAALGESASDAATRAVIATAESLGHAPASPGRRRCVRDALEAALRLAASCDVARAIGVHERALVDPQREAGRAVAMLGLLMHASSHEWPESSAESEARDVGEVFDQSSARVRGYESTLVSGGAR
jgi:hypothetical protein